jgi:hypothetical protein
MQRERRSARSTEPRIRDQSCELEPGPQPLGRGGAGFGGGRGGGASVDAGTYIVTLAVGGKTYTKPLTILQDIWLNER